MGPTIKFVYIATVMAVMEIWALPAVAQMRVPDGDTSDLRIVSSFVAPGEPVPAACREEAHTFARSLVLYPRPSSWHWVLICDEAGWRRFLRLSGREEAAAIYASTDLARRATYIRGSKLLYPFDLLANPDAIVAHELAHIWLNSSNERGAADLARLWQDGLRQDGLRQELR